MSIKPAFQGEVQFVTFADSSKGGPRITLRLAEREQLEPFIGKDGKRYMAVLVEIGDDELPVQQPEPPKEKAKRTTGPICQWLVMRCKETEFQKWLTDFGDFKGPLDEAACADVVRSWCGVESRSEVDGNAQAEARFKRHIRAPWLQHSQTLGA